MCSALIPSTPAALFLFGRFGAASTSSSVMSAFRKSEAGGAAQLGCAGMGMGLGDRSGFTGVRAGEAFGVAGGASGALYRASKKESIAHEKCCICGSGAHCSDAKRKRGYAGQLTQVLMSCTALSVQQLPV